MLFRSASIAILGAIDLTTGERECGRTIMMWESTEEERRDGTLDTLFRGYGIYRVKGHPPLKPWYRVPAVRMGGMYVTEIIRGNVIDPYLEGVIRDHKESLHLLSDLLGELILTDEDDGYTGRFSWLGTEIKVVVSIEYTPPTRPLAFLEEFCRDCERHDRELRSFASEKLEGGETISREMIPEEIYMYFDGDYDAYYKYGKYTVDIAGDRNGPKDIWMEDW